MKWLLEWHDEENYIDHEAWATSWNEVVGYFLGWIALGSDVTRGKVTCYLGDTPYGDGKPCLYFNNAECDEDDE
jgi:hypothetical protein